MKVPRQVIKARKEQIDKERTPDHIFAWIAEFFGPFDLDAAASSSNRKCQKFFDIRDNGLIQPWRGHSVFVHPPKGQEEIWLAKSFMESKRGANITIYLPAITHTAWFQKYAPVANHIHFITKTQPNGAGKAYQSRLVMFFKAGNTNEIREEETTAGLVFVTCGEAKASGKSTEEVIK